MHTSVCLPVVLFPELEVGCLRQQRVAGCLAGDCNLLYGQSCGTEASGDRVGSTKEEKNAGRVPGTWDKKRTGLICSSLTS